ncbi:MAG: hypothetical protein IT204_05910 [Fimbriimonadaceae bacterium]|nr:hypothetical protein [Fimbriimonadaceae bacterium]
MRSAAALAQLTLRAAWRGGSARLVAALLLALALTLPLVLRDDGTVAGRATLLVRLSLTLSQSLLLVYLGWLAADLPARERSDRQIHLLQTRPASLASRLVGRWVGLQVLDATLLLLVGLGLAGNLTWRAGAAPTDRAPGPTALQTLAAWRRYPGQPDPPRLPPGGQQTWRFDNLAAAPRRVDGSSRQPSELRLRYRPRAAGAGPQLDWQAAGSRLSGAVTASNGVVTCPLPADTDGVLTVTNRSPREVVWSGRDRPTLLQPAGGFAANLLRALLLCWLQGGLLAALGLLAGHLWEFATAACVVGGYLLLAVHVPWLPASPRAGLAALAVSAVAPLVQTWPVPDLAAGWRLAASPAAALLAGQTLLCLLLASLLAGRREAAGGEPV